MNDEQRFARMLDVLALLWGRRRVIALGTIVGALLGVTYSLIAPKVYVARVVIHPKEVAARSDGSLAGLAAGGTVGALATGSHLNRVEIVLNSPEVATAVIRELDLLPYLLPDRWDAAQARWKGEAPREHEGITSMQNRLSTRVDSYKLVLEGKVRADNPDDAHRILGAYLKVLNERLKETVIQGAAENREYLESQLEKTTDPLVRDRILQLIVKQIEAGMLLNANAFEVLEGPTFPWQRESPKRRLIVLFATAAAFVLSCLWVLMAEAARNWRGTARGV